MLAGAIGPGRVAAAWADFDAAELGPGVVRVGDRATLLVGELDNLSTERAGLLASHIAGAQLTERILGSCSPAWPRTRCWRSPASATSRPPRSWAIRATGRCCSRWRVRCWPGRRCRPRRLAASTPPTCPVRSPGSSRPAGGPRTRTPRSTWTWRCGTARPTCPPYRWANAAALLARRLAELLRAIEQGRRSCSPSNLDLLAAHERLERLGRPLNAVCSAIGAPDRARTGPLAGRPVGVKDIIAVAGVPTRCGSPASDPRPAAADAVLVRRLREAGAEVFATTQCLEYAAGFAHPEVGDTRNPRDPSRTSGGSSGGSAALVAAGVCDLALGTDTGGSVRIPAAYCGVVGLKPSYGLLPLDGVFPLSPSCDHAGTLTATVAGAADLLAVLAGPASPPTPPGPRRTRDVHGRSPRAPSWRTPRSHPPVRDAVRSALAVLGRGRLADHRADRALARRAGQPGTTCSPSSWPGRRTWCTRTGTPAATPTARGPCWRSARRSATARYAAALGRRAELTAAIEASLAGVDVLAGPTVGYQAPEQDPPFGAGDDNGESRFTGPYNLTGHPAVSLPVPAAGLPAGLQLAGRRGADAALLRVAAAAERLIAEQHQLGRMKASMKA